MVDIQKLVGSESPLEVGQKINEIIENTVRIEETLSNKTDKGELAPLKTAYIVETYQNEQSWYRVYSDGWCEQGGLYTPASDTFNAPIALLKTYQNINYIISTTSLYLNGNYTSSTSNANHNNLAVRSAYLTKKTNGSFSIAMASASYSVIWKACGYIA